MLVVMWSAGALVSVGMLGVVFGLVANENRRHAAFRQLSVLRSWRRRARGRHRRQIRETFKVRVTPIAKPVEPPR